MTDYIDPYKCYESGYHLVDCDEDGYCKLCGFDTDISEEEVEVK